MVIYEWKDWDNTCGVKGGDDVSTHTRLEIVCSLYSN